MNAPARALVVGAHPDDAELFAGGTIAGWIDQGCEVAVLILTDGRLGSPDPSVDPDEVAATRAREAHTAAAVLGVRHVLLERHPDGGLAPRRPEATEAVARAIRNLRPEIVIGHDPWRPYELHPDHRAAGFATTDGTVAAREHHAIGALADLPAHRSRALWLAGGASPTRWVEIDATFERKLDALASHASQFDHLEGWRERVRAWNAGIGEERGYRLAEAFRVIDLPGHDYD